MKLERSAPIRIGHVSQISTIVTDAKIPQNLSDICKEHGVNVLIANN